ncbi:DUF624 domain-containing protein [Lachnospiraceae bacterium 66-29]
MNIFNLEGGLMKSLSKFTDCIYLSVLFLVSCIPVFTIGTAATALYYTAYKVLRLDRGYIFREYITAFKDNFKQTTPVWLLTVLLGTIMGIDWYVMFAYVQDEDVLGALIVVFLVGMIVLTAWAFYLFPFMARFENTRRQSMKNAILLVVAHLPMTIVMLALAAVIAVLIYMIPLFLGLLPAVFSWVQSYILERIFRKYMTEEERAREEEKNYD